MAGGMFIDIYNGKIVVQIRDIDTVGVVIDSLIEEDTKRIVGHEILIGDKKQWEILQDITFKKECQ